MGDLGWSKRFKSQNHPLNFDYFVNKSFDFIFSFGSSLGGSLSTKMYSYLIIQFPGLTQYLTISNHF